MWWINIGCKSPALSRPLLTIDGEKVQVRKEGWGEYLTNWVVLALSWSSETTTMDIEIHLA